MFLGWDELPCRVTKGECIIGAKRQAVKYRERQQQKFSLEGVFAAANDEIASENRLLRRRLSQEQLSTHHFSGVTAYADVDDLVTCPAGAQEDSAAPLHLYTLLQQNFLVCGNHAALHRPRRARTCGRAGGRIFSVVKEHARLQPRIRV